MEISFKGSTFWFQISMSRVVSVIYFFPAAPVGNKNKFLLLRISHQESAKEWSPHTFGKISVMSRGTVLTTESSLAGCVNDDADCLFLQVL